MIQQDIKLVVRKSKRDSNYLAIQFEEGMYFIADFGLFSLNKTILRYMEKNELLELPLTAHKDYYKTFDKSYINLYLNIAVVGGEPITFLVDTLPDYKKEMRHVLQVKNGGRI